MEFDNKLSKKKASGDVLLEVSVNILYGVAATFTQIMAIAFTWNAMVDVGRLAAPRINAGAALLLMLFVHLLMMKNQPDEPELPSAALRKQTLVRLFACLLIMGVVWITRAIAL